MAKISAGILIYRISGKKPEVLLVHPGGPFWAKKDLHAWSIPKGEPEENEELLDAAIREVLEETGIIVEGPFIELNPVKQKSGKMIHAWGLEKDVNTKAIKSNNFEIEWPPRSGKKSSFPEIDKAEWFSIEEARERIIPGQSPLLDELERYINII